MTTMKQPFQCNLQPEIQEPHRTTHTDTTTRCKTHGGTIRAQNDPSRNRRTDEVAFIAGCRHFKRKNTRFGAPASSPTHSPCNIMQPFQCNLQPEIQEPHRTTHTDTTTRCKTHRRNNSRTKRPQPQPPHRRGSFHRRLQPLYTEKHKVWCSGFLPNTQPMQHACVTTSHRLHFPLSPLPPFIKVNSIDSYSFVLYCSVMYCYVIYHPSSRSIPPLLPPFIRVNSFLMYCFVV